MKFSLKIKENAIKALLNKEYRALETARIGMVRGMELFSSKIIEEQMTGRPGLNVQSGTLRSSWHVRQWLDGNTAVVSLGTSTSYAIYHQKPPGYKYSPPWKVPKRLFVLEDFKKSGFDIISKQTARALFTEFKKT